MNETYVAFLRGINVGGHHKVPMQELRDRLPELGFANIQTVLNTGNIIFDSAPESLDKLENRISEFLENHFGFPIPCIIRSATFILQLCEEDPFADIKLHKKIRLYISLLKKENQGDVEIPWSSSDASFRILAKRAQNILSVLDLDINGTPQGMEALENFYGKEITTRNWNTIKRIEKKLLADKKGL